MCRRAPTHSGQRRRAVGCAAVLALLCAAPTTAAIIVQRSIAGVSLAMTRASVRSVLGSPERVVRGRNEFGSYTVFVYPGLTVTFQGDARVSLIRTTRRAERTASGVGVGSRERDVRRRVRGVRCRGTGAERACTVGRFLPGRRVTSFELRRGRVRSVAIGFVID